MLREIELDHFKCFESLTLPLRRFTLLTGINASGKSTIIQALMLLTRRQSTAERVVSSEDVIVHFFRPRATAESIGGPQVITPTIDETGNIDHWPAGFFDQFEKDLGYLAGL